MTSAWHDVMAMVPGLITLILLRIIPFRCARRPAVVDLGPLTADEQEEEPSLSPRAPLIDRGRVNDWCIACDGIKKRTGFGWTVDQLHYFCVDCRDDYDDPDKVLNPRPAVVDQQVALQAAIPGPMIGRSSQDYVREIEQAVSKMNGREFECAWCKMTYQSAAPVPTGSVLCRRCRHKLNTSSCTTCHRHLETGTAYGLYDGEPTCERCMGQRRFIDEGRVPTGWHFDDHGPHIPDVKDLLMVHTQAIVQDAAEQEVEAKTRQLLDEVEAYCRNNNLPIPPQAMAARRTLEAPKDDPSFDVQTPSRYATLGLCEDCCDLVEEYELARNDEPIPVGAFCMPDIKRVSPHSTAIGEGAARRRVVSVSTLQRAAEFYPVPAAKYTIAEKQQLERESHSDRRKRA